MDGAPPELPVVHCVGVHVHPDKAVGPICIEPTAEALGMSQGLGSVRQAVFDARLQVARNGAHQLTAQVASDHVAAQRQREPCLLIPPLTHVRPEVQPAVRKSELPLVDQEARVGFAGGDELLDLIECDNDMARSGLVEPECEKRRRELSRDGDQATRERLSRVAWRSLAGDDARTIAIADAGAVREQA